MARIAPESFPDRFALERHAKALRRQEFDRLMAAATEWVRARLAGLAHPGTQPTASASGHAHR